MPSYRPAGRGFALSECRSRVFVQSTATVLQDYVRKLDPATNVGLNADSIGHYTVGEVCRRKGIQTS